MFVLQGFSNINAGANIAAPQFFSYESSTDNIAAISAAGYFNSVNFGINVNDLMFISATDSNGFFVVTAITPNLTINMLAQANIFSYQGLWNATTNTPTLSNPPGASTAGYVYQVSVAGTQFGISWNVGDLIISNGSAWQQLTNNLVTAAEVSNVPSGNISATNVQAAINELDTEKVAIAGSTMTGLLILSANPGVALGAATKQYVDNADALLIPLAQKGVASGVATLDGSTLLQQAQIPSGIDAAKIGAGTVSTTEYGYLSTVTSDIQTQINNLASGQVTKEADAVAVVNITVSNPGTAVFDGTTVTSGQIVLLQAQSSQPENGLYVFNGSAVAMTRASTMNTWADVVGSQVIVPASTTYSSGSVWRSTSATGGTIDVTAITFSLMPNGAYTASTGLTLTGNAFSITATGVSAGVKGSASSVPVITLNAQGQVTAETDTPIAITNGQVSGLGTASTRTASDAAQTYVASVVNASATIGQIPIFADGTGTIQGQFTPSTTMYDTIPVVNTSTINNLVAFDDSSGTLKDSGIPGNTFNGANQLVQMTAATKLPAVDGSLLTGVVAATNATITLTGDVTGSGTGTFAATVGNSAVIGKVLTGLSPSVGAVAATDTILQAFNKVVANNSLNALASSFTSVNNATTGATNNAITGEESRWDTQTITTLLVGTPQSVAFTYSSAFSNASAIPTTGVFVSGGVAVIVDVVITAYSTAGCTALVTNLGLSTIASLQVIARADGY